MSCRERGSGPKRGAGCGRELSMPGRRLSRARPSVAGRLVRTGISDRDGSQGGDRPCHDADTPGGQSFAAGMAGRSGGSRAMGNHAIALRISAESAGGQRSGHRWEPAAQRRPERRGINLSHPLQPIREASRSSAGLPTHRALTSGHGHNRQPHAPSTSPGTGNAGQRPRRATQSRSAAATCASIPRTMARSSRYACHIFSLPGRGRRLLG